MNRRRTIANTFVFPLAIHRSISWVVLGARGHLVDHNAIQGKTVNPRHYRWAVGIHARDLNHDPPTIIAMIGMQLVLVLLFGIDVGRVLPDFLLNRRYRKKHADSQGVHHRQTGSRGSMNPGGGGKIQRIRGNVARTPLHRVQGFHISLQTEFAGAAGQSNPFQRGLEKIAIQVLVAAVVSLLSNGARGDSYSREVSRVRKPIAERIVYRRTNGLGMLVLVMNLTLTLHVTVTVIVIVTAVVRIRVVVILIKQRRQGIKMITHAAASVFSSLGCESKLIVLILPFRLLLTTKIISRYIFCGSRNIILRIFVR
jgi:hypothetical protein